MDQLNIWLTTLFLGYCVTAWALLRLRKMQDPSYKSFPGREAKSLFDGMVFATCIMILIGIYYPDAFKLLGDTHLFIALAAAAGLSYAIRSLWV